MSTLDNLNENILQKLDLIEKINLICINHLNIKLFKLSSDYNYFNYKIHNNSDIFKRYYKNVPMSFLQNLKILNNKYNQYLETKYSYEVQSIMFLTEYYNLHNNKLQITMHNNIYNDNIFLLSSNSLLLTNNDLLFLKNIYYNNYYKYKYYNISNNSNNTLNTSNIDNVFNKNNLSSSTNNLNSSLSKKLYHKFNIFISSEDIYGILDSYIDFINNFLLQYKDLLININVNKNSLDKFFKKIYQLINQYKKTKLIYSIENIEYDICSCGQKMIIQANTSELLCTKCGTIHTLIGSVFEDSQFYNQEGNRYLHGTYDPNRHCKFWVDRIQAKENTIINDSIIEKIKQCIKKDKIENLKNISIDQFRIYLKQIKLSKLNDHIPLIKKIITGYIPPQLTHKELHLLFNYFDKATKIYTTIKPKEKSNSLYYPFLIWKILDLIIEDKQKKKELLSCIHLQSYETLIDNDKIWYQICKHNDKFIYKPTDKSILY
jgi:hypothetical protein